MMLATTFKQKLPNGLSFPIGAEKLSEALARAPHLDELRLTFSCGISGTYKKIRDGLPICVLHARYNPFISIVAKSHWELHVGAIPSHLCEVCNNALIATGLPSLVEWLQQSTRSDWEPTRAKSIDLIFQLSDYSLSIVREVRP